LQYRPSNMVNAKITWSKDPINFVFWVKKTERRYC